MWFIAPAWHRQHLKYQSIFEVKVETQLAASKQPVNGLFNNLPRIYEHIILSFVYTQQERDFSVKLGGIRAPT